MDMKKKMLRPSTLSRIRRRPLASLYSHWYYPPSTSLIKPLTTDRRKLFTAATSSQADPIAGLPDRDPKKPFFVSTPIFYVNAAPHIGHLHSMVIADVLSRYHQLRTGRASFMTTGTDEHGMKVQRAASANGKSPGELCAAVSARFRDLADAANVKYHDFIRTTEPRHHAAAQHLWTSLSAKGYIYKGKYEGWYSVSDEAYYAPNQVHKTIDPLNGSERMTSIESGQAVEWIEEENYMFKLSEFQDRLLDWLSNNPTALISSQRSDIMQQLNSRGLTDLSISRPISRLSWGVSVPGDPKQIMYVWMDALTNYLTVTGYPWKADKCVRWPANVHVVGKDIIKFHAIYWPAMLMGAGLELPKSVIAHGHWKMQQEKMSKSRGNVVDPLQAMEEWGVDCVRYYLMRAPGSLWGDADWAPDRVNEHYRKDLSGQLGNLLARISAPKLWNRLPPGRRSGASLFYPPDMNMYTPNNTQELRQLLQKVPNVLEIHMDAFEIPKALKAIFDVLAEANRLVQETAPWHDSTPPEAAYHCLHLCAESLRIAGILLQPFIPTKASELLDSLGVPNERRRWSDLELGSAAGSGVKAGASHLFPKKQMSPEIALAKS